jgi:hypothetical protein
MGPKWSQKIGNFIPNHFPPVLSPSHAMEFNGVRITGFFLNVAVSDGTLNRRSAISSPKVIEIGLKWSQKIGNFIPHHLHPVLCASHAMELNGV